jgi:hypothetical protein
VTGTETVLLQPGQRTSFPAKLAGAASGFPQVQLKLIDMDSSFEFQSGLFKMRGRRHGESLFHCDVAQGLWFRQVTHDVKLTNLQSLPGVRRIASKGKPDACRRE